MEQKRGEYKKNTTSTPVVIDVQNVKKKFMIYYDRGVTLKEKVLFKNRRRHEEHWVLKGISFQVHKGEAIGLVGENGCGKSTTLKMLTKILYPDSGTITMKGRVSSLIELGAGFHPDMSGRENIYTNASIFGLKREEIDKRLQAIIDFSELGDYIDNPVRTYSSGMYMRLAFAVAINVDADILLIDEILAVGDAAFQSKCFNKLREIKRMGTTIVIVSHVLGQIEQICERSIWIDNGVIREQGAPMDVHQKYLRFMSEKKGPLDQAKGTQESGTVRNKRETSMQDAAVEQITEQLVLPVEQEEAETIPENNTYAENTEKHWGSKDAFFSSIDILNAHGEETESLITGESFTIQMKYKVRRPVEDVIVGIGIFRNDGLQCYGTNTLIDHIKPLLNEHEGIIHFSVDNNGLLEGEYLLDVALHKPDGFSYDYFRECLRFSVRSEIKDIGVSRLGHEWEFI